MSYITSEDLENQQKERIRIKNLKGADKFLHYIKESIKTLSIIGIISIVFYLSFINEIMSEKYCGEVKKLVIIDNKFNALIFSRDLNKSIFIENLNPNVYYNLNIGEVECFKLTKKEIN